MISCLQKAALLGTAFILKKIFGISESGQLSDVKAFFSPHSGDVIQKKKLNDNNHNNNKGIK